MLKTCGYWRSLEILVTKISLHRQLGFEIEHLRDVIIQRLYYQDSVVALALFWLFICPADEFKPSSNELSKWPLLHLELEFDHQGRFTEIPSKFTGTIG